MAVSRYHPADVGEFRALSFFCRLDCLEAFVCVYAGAIQDSLLTAPSLSLGSLWFTLFEKDPLREILTIEREKDPVALICIGKPAGEPFQTPRKTVQEKTTHRE